MSTHTRIRKFNTKDTYPNQSLDNDLCGRFAQAIPFMFAVRLALTSKAIW